MKSKLGLVAEITKKQTNRTYFENIPIGTKFIIVAEHDNMPAYDLTGYFLKYPPQKLNNNKFHYTGYIQKGSWKVVGTIADYVGTLAM